MTILTQEQTKRICDRVLSLSKADECIVTVNGSRQGNIRFARNAVSTAGLAEDTSIAVQVAFGKRQGTATINEFDDKSLEKAVRRAEDLARLAPENPEFMPAVAKQNYRASETFSKKTAAIDPEFRAQSAAYAIEACRKNKLVAAGFFTDSTSFTSVANSNGVFGHQDPDRPRFHLHRAHRRRPRFGLGQALGHRRRTLRSARSGRRGHRKGAAFGRREGAGAGPLHRDPGAGRDLRTARLHAERLRRPPDRRRPQLPVEEGRRLAPGRQAVRQPGQHLGRPVEPGRAGAALGPRTCSRASAWTSSRTARSTP
jgi:hypothetical protein